MTSPTLTPPPPETAPELTPTADTSTPAAGSFLVAIDRIQLQPGSCLTLNNLTWLEFEAVLEALGEKRSSRLVYCHGLLELMVPLPEHEKPISLLSDLVKATLSLQERDWECLRSTTFKNDQMEVGIEPDDCFYVQNYAVIFGKERLDLNVDPPPDLAIESDVTSLTRTETYVALGVPELWIFRSQALKIFHLTEKDGQSLYLEQDHSLMFPDLPIKSLILQALQATQTQGVRRALEAHKARVREILALVSPQE